MWSLKDIVLEKRQFPKIYTWSQGFAFLFPPWVYILSLSKVDTIFPSLEVILLYLSSGAELKGHTPVLDMLLMQYCLGGINMARHGYDY